MKKVPSLVGVLLLALVFSAQAKNTIIRRVNVLAGANGTELEISTDDPVTPSIQVVTGPDRLVIDFPNSTPASSLRNLALARGEVTGVRVALFSSAPPVTRVVVDLKMPQSYQMFPSHKSVIVKLGPPETEFEVVNVPPPATRGSARAARAGVVQQWIIKSLGRESDARRSAKRNPSSDGSRHRDPLRRRAGSSDRQLRPRPRGASNRSAIEWLAL